MLIVNRRVEESCQRGDVFARAFRARPTASPIRRRDRGRVGARREGLAILPACRACPRLPRRPAGRRRGAPAPT